MKTFTTNPDEKTFLKIVVENAPQGSSMSISEVRQAIRVLDIIDSSTTVITLEDSDHTYLVTRLNQGSFIRADKMVIEIFDKVVNAT